LYYLVVFKKITNIYHSYSQNISNCQFKKKLSFLTGILSGYSSELLDFNQAVRLTPIFRPLA